MKSKRRLLGKSRLYLILDKDSIAPGRLPELLKKINKSKGIIVQLRDKHSGKKEILEDALLARAALSEKDKLFIVNDHADIALISGSDGLHIGQQDISLASARKILGEDKIIGVSCHNLKQALEAQAQGADYIGIGPVFATTTKKARPIGLSVLGKLKKTLRIPYFAIGGIKKENLSLLLSRGVKRICSCRAIMCSRDPDRKIKEFLSALN